MHLRASLSIYPWVIYGTPIYTAWHQEYCVDLAFEVEFRYHWFMALQQIKYAGTQTKYGTFNIIVLFIELINIYIAF